MTELKDETDNSTIIVRDFNPLLSVIDRTRNKINKEMEDLNNTINQLLKYLANIYRALYSTTAEYPLFPRAQ